MTSLSTTTRREFLLEASLSGVAVSALARDVFASQQSATATGLPTRVLGRTPERVSILCLGGWHIGSVKDPSEAIRIMHTAVDEGLTFFDNCWDYHDGGSEEIMGRALAGGRRDKVFLMTKNCERDYAGSMKCLDDSLRRLQTDRIDLWQFHEIIYDNDPDWVFDKGGLRAAIEARKAGKVRYIGFTGHKDPRIHLSMLGKPFEWDTCQFPVNALDLHYRSFQKQVLPVCLKRKIGAIGMKGLGGGNGIAQQAGLTPEAAYRYALSQPIASQVVGMTTVDQLQRNITLARTFKPFSEAEQSALAEKVKPFATDGRFEQFKSTQVFDGPVHRRQHGFTT